MTAFSDWLEIAILAVVSIILIGFTLAAGALFGYVLMVTVNFALGITWEICFFGLIAWLVFYKHPKVNSPWRHPKT